MRPNQIASKETESKARGDRKEETGSASKEEDPEAISKIVSSLARLEQSHMEQNKILVLVNQQPTMKVSQKYAVWRTR